MQEQLWQTQVGVTLIAVVSAVAVVAAGASPTGGTVVDAVLIALAAGVTTWLSAGAPTRLLAALVLVAGGLSGSIVLAAVGVAIFAGVLLISWSDTRRPVVNAFLGAAALTLAAHSDLGRFMGASAIVAISIGIVIAVAGLGTCPSRTRRIVLAVVGVAATAMVVGTAATVAAALASDTELNDADALSDAGLRALAAGNIDVARQSFAEAAVDFQDVHDRFSSPLTWPARFVPVLAQHRRAANVVTGGAAATTRLVNSQLASFDLSALTARAGGIDLDAVAALAAPLERIDESLAGLQSDLDQVRDPWLVGRLQTRLDDLDIDLSEEQARGRRLLDAIDTAPALLGAEGVRNYLVAFTTPAEARGLGGFMGNWALISVDDGEISLADFGRTQRLEDAIEPGSLTLTGPDEWLQRYGQFGFTNAPGGTVGDAPWKNYTMSPQADSTGEVARQLFTASRGIDIDGYFAIDVIALSHLLEFTGPVDTDIGTRLDSTNAVDFLLNGQYAATDRAGRRELLDEVSHTVLDRLLSRPLPGIEKLLAEMGPMVQEDRLVGWALRPQEQAVFQASGLAGGLARVGDGDGVAVTFNNAIGNKLDYFFRARATYEVEIDAESSTAHAALELRIENKQPTRPQVPYVADNKLGLPSGTNRTYISIYTRLPVTDLEVDGSPVVGESGLEAGYFVTSIFIDTEPGEQRTITLTAAGTVDLTDGYRLALHAPPTVRPTPISADVTVTHGGVGADQHRQLATDAGTAQMTLPING